MMPRVAFSTTAGYLRRTTAATSAGRQGADGPHAKPASGIRAAHYYREPLGIRV